MSFPMLLILALASGVATLEAQTDATLAVYSTVTDLEFAKVGGQKLLLDLFLPAKASKPPLVLYIHGGGWRSGTRKDVFPLFLAKNGYAVASIDYRLSSVATFPAQIFDCKGTARWLRAHAGEYGYDADRIAAMGTSAGGHLAVLLGTSGGMQELEGDVGGNLGHSSRIQAVVDFFGPVDFILRSKDQPEQTDKAGGKVYQLLGKPVRDNLDLARLASGAFHVTPDDPPLIIFHGTKDRTVLINQSHRIRDAFTTQGLKVEFHTVEGGGHGGPQFSTPERSGQVLKFLGESLKK